MALGLLTRQSVRGETNGQLDGLNGDRETEEIMHTVNQTMTHMVVGLGLLLAAAGAWAMLQEFLPGTLQ